MSFTLLFEEMHPSGPMWAIEPEHASFLSPVDPVQTSMLQCGKGTDYVGSPAFGFASADAMVLSIVPLKRKTTIASYGRLFYEGP